MRRQFTVIVVGAALAMPASPALAHHDHFVYISSTHTCQYVAHGQTSIDEPAHGGHHRFHDNVHTGTPGTDLRGNTFDKQDNVSDYRVDGQVCTERGQG